MPQVNCQTCGKTFYAKGEPGDSFKCPGCGLLARAGETLPPIRRNAPAAPASASPFGLMDIDPTAAFKLGFYAGAGAWVFTLVLWAAVAILYGMVLFAGWY